MGDGVWVHENGPGRVQIDGACFYRTDVTFDSDWTPKRFKLADALQVEGVEIPAESDVSRMPGLGQGAYWFHVRLADSVVSEGRTFEREDALFFESVGRFLRPHSPRLVDAGFDEKTQLPAR